MRAGAAGMLKRRPWIGGGGGAASSSSSSSSSVCEGGEGGAEVAPGPKRTDGDGQAGESLPGAVTDMGGMNTGA